MKQHKGVKHAQKRVEKKQQFKKHQETNYTGEIL